MAFLVTCYWILDKRRTEHRALSIAHGVGMNVGSRFKVEDSGLILGTGCWMLDEKKQRAKGMVQSVRIKYWSQCRRVDSDSARGDFLRAISRLDLSASVQSSAIHLLLSRIRSLPYRIR
jgi:hypothetical protein